MLAMRMSVGRFVAAGLTAGVFANASGLALVHFVLSPDQVETLLSHMSYEPGPITMVPHLSMRLLVGFVAAGLVVGLTPRLRTRARTALGAAAAIYLIGYLPSAFLLHDFDILIGSDFWITLAWCAIEVYLACLLAAAIYRDRRPLRVDTIAAAPRPEPQSGTDA